MRKYCALLTKTNFSKLSVDFEFLCYFKLDMQHTHTFALWKFSIKNFNQQLSLKCKGFTRMLQMNPF